MKNLFLAILMATGTLTVSAQTKIGYISTEDLIGDMPEADAADAELKKFQAELTQTGQDMMHELTMKDSIFVRDSSKLSLSMKEVKREELIGLYSKVQNWNTKAQDLYQARAQELIGPIRNKAMDAIKAVAKENGYTYVLDINTVIVAPPGDDLLPLVRKKLGIKAPATQDTAPKK